MKVELLVSRSGPGGAQNVGDVVEVSDAEAKRLMEHDPPWARPVRTAPEPERATPRRKAKR